MSHKKPPITPTEREINEKLAKWCGWQKKDRYQIGPREYDVWVRPNGTFAGSHCPDFCNSLDAQAEHLWPKLPLHQHTSVVAAMVDDNHAFVASPALATTKAILAAIEGQE